MAKSIIRVPEFQSWLEQAGLPLSLVTKHGDTIYVSGMPPIMPNSTQWNANTLKEQVTQVLDNIGLCLKAAGTNYSNVLKCTIYACNVAHFAAINDVYRQYFPKDPPARTFCAVASWPAPFDVEIECVAAV